MVKFSNEQLEKMKNLYVIDNLSTTEIGKIFNVSRSVIIYNLNKLGVKMRPRGRKVNLEDITNKIDSPEFDYFLGILATDGCICNNIISLEFSEENKEILYYWKEFLGNTVAINIHTNAKGIDYYKIAFQNSDIAKLLESYGIVPRKSYTLKLKYINWNVLRGIFDGDGSLSLDTRHGLSGKFRIASGSEEFLLQIKDFLFSNNIKSTIYKDSSCNCMNLTVGIISDIVTIYNNIYKDSSYFLKRKYDKFGPLLEKFNKYDSVNSVNERENSKTEPSPDWEGAETRNGEPK